jgi:type III secretory pathway component EscV
MNENEQYAYGKVVDDLTVEELIEYDNNNVHILLVRNKVSDEVREVAKGTFVFIYDGLDDEKIQQVLSMLRNKKGDDTNET